MNAINTATSNTSSIPQRPKCSISRYVAARCRAASVVVRVTTNSATNFRGGKITEKTSTTRPTNTWPCEISETTPVSRLSSEVCPNCSMHKNGKLIAGTNSTSAARANEADSALPLAPLVGAIVVRQRQQVATCPGGIVGIS